MKKQLALAMSLALGFSSIGFAQEVKVQLDGKDMNFSDVKPVIQEGRTLVPMRAISEGLGAKVEWDEKTSTVKLIKGEKDLSFKIGEKGSITQNGRTLVPVRFVSENLGAEVDWNEETQTVLINTQNIPEVETAKKQKVEKEEKKPATVPAQKKEYTELSGLAHKTLAESGLTNLQHFELVKYNDKLNYDKVYEITKKDLPIRLGDMVLTKIEIDDSIYNQQIMYISGYVLKDREKNFSNALIDAGYIDGRKIYRKRQTFATSLKDTKVYQQKYPNIKICEDFENNIFDTEVKPGEKFTFAYDVYDRGDENNGIKDQKKFTGKDINKIVIYNSFEETDILVLDTSVLEFK